MKKKSTIPTLIGIFILILGLVSGIVLINSRQVFKIEANIDAEPKNVRVSNITDNSATITWTTDIKSTGFVKWGNSEGSLSKVSLEENSEKEFVHSVTIIGTTQNSTIFFKINSDSNDYLNQGIPWQTKSNSSNKPKTGSLIASGTILEADGSTPAQSIIYLTINGIVLSAQTSSSGNFIIPVSTYVTAISDSTAIEMSVQGGILGTSQAIIYSKSIKFIPAIILGKSYDFRTATNTGSDKLPESSLNVPESVTISSRFEITKSDKPKSDTATNLKIESINEGEIINTNNPEFFGSGPKNADIEITIESELQTGSLKTDSKGEWKWSPPNNLEPGEHKLTIKWRDLNGILRTVTKSFVVSAAEGPAFNSTPSATPLNTILPSSTPVATKIATSSASGSPIGTLKPTPATGSLTPTIGLFIMGIGIFLSSILIWNKSYAE